MPNQVRAEGIAELVGDVLIQCQGGTVAPAGVSIPTVNIQAFLNTNVTSRLLDSVNGYSEALLLIDEPAPAQQRICTADKAPCAVKGTGVVGSSPYLAAGAYNVFQGTAVGNNSIVWNVPIDQPGTTVATQLRNIRITNIRANASLLPVYANLIPPSILAYVQTAPSTAFPITSPTETVALLKDGLQFSIRQCDNSADMAPRFDQDVSQNASLYANGSGTGSMQFALGFKEAFATAFELNLQAGQDPSVPGTNHGSESGFVNSSAFGNQIGLATQSTRLLGKFSGVPAGVRLFVTTGPLKASTSFSQAVLIGGADANGAGGAVASSVGTATSSLTGETQPIAEIPLTGGAGQAVWEVTSSSNSQFDLLLFGVVVAYQSAGGLPGLGTASVGGTLTPVSTVTTASQADPVPRFASTSGQNMQATFTTKQANSVPSAPILVSPANGTQGRSIVSVPFTWSFDSSADSNDVYFGTSSNPPLVGNTTLGRFVESGLAAQTTYYWKVVSKNRLGSTSSAVWSLTTEGPPAAPVLVSPANGATGTPAQVTLTWKAAANAQTYHVYLGKDSSYLFQSGVTGATAVAFTLFSNTTYYWRVDAINTAGTASSATWSFTTTSSRRYRR